jgi:hypothetical protein
MDFKESGRSELTEGHPRVAVMPSSRCKQCDQPVIEIDHYGERFAPAINGQG